MESQDNNERRHLMSNALHLIRTTKGRNLIITSEARKAMEIRGPYDVVNLYPFSQFNCFCY